MDTQSGGGAATDPPPESSSIGANKRRPLLGAALALLLVLIVVAASFLFNTPRTSTPAASPTATTESPSETPTPSPTPPPAPAPAPPTLPELPPAPMNILLIGSDIRGNARQEAEHAAATGQRADHRADALILMHIPADRHRVYGISIMRDLWVNIPGYGGSKINASLEAGGTQLVADTVGSLLNTRVDHTVMLDFNGLKTLVDGLGGIDVHVPVPFTSTHDTRHTFAPGINRLDGQAALEFARERYAFTDGDYQRVRNQQALIRAIMARMTTSGTLYDPASVINVINFAAPYITVDQSFDLTAMASLAFALRNTDPWAAQFMTLPTAGTGFSADGQSIVLPDYGGIAAVSAALAEGRLAELAAAYG